MGAVWPVQDKSLRRLFNVENEFASRFPRDGWLRQRLVILSQKKIAELSFRPS